MLKTRWKGSSDRSFLLYRNVHLSVAYYRWRQNVGAMLRLLIGCWEVGVAVSVCRWAGAEFKHTEWLENSAYMNKRCFRWISVPPYSEMSDLRLAVMFSVLLFLSFCNPWVIIWSSSSEGQRSDRGEFPLELFDVPSDRDKWAVLMSHPAAGSCTNKLEMTLMRFLLFTPGLLNSAPDSNTTSNYARRFFNLFNHRLLCR